jgi:transposase
MAHHILGQSRTQTTLFPEVLDDFVTEDNPVRVVDLFVESLDLETLGFERVVAKGKGRPGYHPAILLKLYIYGYLNRIQSSRRLEKESHRNVELMWLVERLPPDFKTIADFRKDNGKGINCHSAPKFRVKFGH